MAFKHLIKNCSYYIRRHCLLIGWVILNIAVFTKSYYHYLTHLEYFYLRRLTGHGLSISRGSAAVLNLSCALILLPVCRKLNSTVHRILGRYSRFFLTCWFTHLKSVHIAIAITIVISSLIHSSGHVLNAINFSHHFDVDYPEINWASYKGESPFTLILTSVVGVTGVLMLFLLLLMVLLSTNYIRQLDYDLFWGSHFLFIIFLLLFFIHPLKGVLTKQINIHDHVPGCKVKFDYNHSFETLTFGNDNKIRLASDIFDRNFIDLNNSYYIDNLNKTDSSCLKRPIFSHMKTQSWMWIIGPLLIYLIDIALRVHSRNYDNTFVIKSAEMLPGDVVNLKIISISPQIITLPSSSLNRKIPSQYVLLQCPKIAPLEWHPFTVVNTFRDGQGYLIINLLIRIRGDWTRSVCNSSLKSKQNGDKPLRLLVDGPFFSPIQNVVNSAVVICIAAGIGITPFAGVLQHIIKEDIRTMCQPFRIHLVWVIRTPDQLIWIQDLLIKFYEKLLFQNQLERFDFRVFITKDCALELTKDKYLNKIFSMENISISIGRRPNWFDILSDWQQYYERGTIRVFLSGPPTLIDEVENTCHKLNRNSYGCHLKCIVESFC